MKMTRSEKVEYIQSSMLEGYKPYFEMPADQVDCLSSSALEIEFDCAKNWQGDE